MVKATVAAVIARSGQDLSVILLTRRSVNPFKGYWCLPGGHIDAGETAIAAVGREVVEETGLTFAHPEFFCYSDERFPEHNFHAVALAFSGTASGDLLLMPEEVESAGWFTLEEAFSKPLAFNHESILKRYAAILEI